MLRNGLEPWHLLILAVIVIALFGSKKLPEAARALGKSARILKSEAQAMKNDNASAPAPQVTVTEAAQPTPAPAAAMTEPRPADL
ncbi:Sec-independent protein translocase subunit TatA [Streptomyces sp. NBC_00102]|uniref:Sec-independent protein translocase subunit TatA n=1 Tax=Streptomyces sp. NBC_00102 TaxID=2975652 RepID=UPI00225C0529|nr:Sec-independent protein translocase subunit TatA [Streptomyces sp. NBC_00102]MCX5398624.1 Sec-independent protein translocase subunit TatA [Streptomyces sp. NBC_00102]